jgi:hypothetical protein
MHVVYFFENRNLLLSQLLRQIPSEGEVVKIKGRKAKVSSVKNVDEKSVHVQVILETVNKNKVLVDDSKKKKR